MDEEDPDTTPRQRRQEVDPDDQSEGGYGAETDWWSCGAMLYEMAYGVTPFFAETIKTTYLRIMDFEVYFNPFFIFNLT